MAKRCNPVNPRFGWPACVNSGYAGVQLFYTIHKNLSQGCEKNTRYGQQIFTITVFGCPD